jgi:hypothetical protein
MHLIKCIDHLLRWLCTWYSWKQWFLLWMLHYVFIMEVHIEVRWLNSFAHHEGRHQFELLSYLQQLVQHGVQVYFTHGWHTVAHRAASACGCLKPVLLLVPRQINVFSFLSANAASQSCPGTHPAPLIARHAAHSLALAAGVGLFFSCGAHNLGCLKSTCVEGLCWS